LLFFSLVVAISLMLPLFLILHLFVNAQELSRFPNFHVYVCEFTESTCEQPVSKFKLLISSHESSQKY
jgi:hypothetical protein